MKIILKALVMASMLGIVIPSQGNICAVLNHSVDSKNGYKLTSDEYSALNSAAESVRPLGISKKGITLDGKPLLMSSVDENNLICYNERSDLFEI